MNAIENNKYPDMAHYIITETIILVDKTRILQKSWKLLRIGWQVSKKR